MGRSDLYENVEAAAITVNGDHYRNELSNCFFLVVDENDNFSFQQDGADMAHM